MPSPIVSPEFADYLMGEALLEAEKSASNGEVPVGAVIAVGTEIIARAGNSTENDLFVGSHAEMAALRQASQYQKNWRLGDAVICVTLEPCTMCCGAIRLARLPVLIFGAGDSKQGAVGSLCDLTLDPRLGPPPRVIRHHRATECSEILKRFFSTRRSPER